MSKAQFDNPAAFNVFAFGGKATFTLVSKKTGERFTYKITESDDGRMFFVAVLTGPDNWANYTYIGHFRGPDYFHGQKSKIAPTAPSARAMQWFALQLRKAEFPPSLEVWHEGKCGVCGRKLTVPASVASGIGPECAERLGVPRIACTDPDELSF